MATLYSLGAVTVKAYRVHTADETNTDAQISGALVEAEDLLDEELRRHLAKQERTGTFPIYCDGRIYPDAYPLTASDLTIDGRALRGAEPDGGPFIGVWEHIDDPRATVTWTGGYDSTSLPRTLELAVYDLARGLMAEALVPVGATSVSLGDASVTYAVSSRGGVDALVPGISSRVRRYQNRFVA
jgi:hypothetical protein